MASSLLAKGIQLTLMMGPVIPLPAPRPVMDALDRIGRGAFTQQGVSRIARDEGHEQEHQHAQDYPRNPGPDNFCLAVTVMPARGAIRFVTLEAPNFLRVPQEK